MSTFNYYHNGKRGTIEAHTPYRAAEIIGGARQDTVEGAPMPGEWMTYTLQNGEIVQISLPAN